MTARGSLSMACSAFRSLLAVATDAGDVAMIAARVVRCGLPVLNAVEARKVLPALEAEPDVMVIHVRQGRELHGYYAGLAARLRQIPVIFIIPDIGIPTVQALLGALPLSEYIEHHRDDAELTAKIIGAFGRRGRQNVL